METLRQGSKAIPVMLLQRLLNKKGGGPVLTEDGQFGSGTKRAVKAFQRREGITSDGVVGSTTWRKLGLTIDIAHNVRLFAQPTGMTCWSAAATMILQFRGHGMSVGPGSAALTNGGLSATYSNVERFADELGWTMYPPTSWTVGGLTDLLRHGPIWAAGLASGSGHVVVLSAVWSDGEEGGTGTVIRVHDPWPPNVGSVYGDFYDRSVKSLSWIGLYFLQS